MACEYGSAMDLKSRNFDYPLPTAHVGPYERGFLGARGTPQVLDYLLGPAILLLAVVRG